MHLVLRDHRAHRGYLKHLMALRLRVLAVQWLMASGAEHGLERDHHIDLFDRHQRPCLSLVPGLPSRPTPTGRPALALLLAVGGITRRGPRRGARVLTQA